MKVLSFDPGAARCGYAFIEGGDYTASGILGLPRSKEITYTEYQRQLIDYWTREGEFLIRTFAPDLVLTEIVPAKGFSDSAQSLLASTVSTVIHSISATKNVDHQFISGTEVKKYITGDHRASKVKVRDGVISLCPGLADRKSDWTKVFDESDAIAIGITGAEKYA